MTYDSDFKLRVHGDSVKILQLTDTQVIDSSKRRYAERLSEAEIKCWSNNKIGKILQNEMKALVFKTKPDIIIVTGDFIYGEFDDDGTSFKSLVEFLDSFNIPWSMCYGNHEKESEIGVENQCTMLESGRNCLYKRENYAHGLKLEGDGTFSIDILDKHGEVKTRLCLLDSGSGTQSSLAGIYANQLKWIKLQKHVNAQKFAFLHIPPYCFDLAIKQYGYSYEDFSVIEIPNNENGDFGVIGERVLPQHYIDIDGDFFSAAKESGFSAIFAGHVHKNYYRVMYEDVCLIYGLKTGKYDSHPQNTGGTLIEVDFKCDAYKINYIKS